MTKNINFVTKSFHTVTYIDFELIIQTINTIVLIYIIESLGISVDNRLEGIE